MPYSLKSIGDANLPVTLVSATYSALDTDYVIDATSGTFTVTLPTSVGITNKLYIIKNSGAGVVSVATTSSQTIDGSATPRNLPQYGSLSIQSDGSNWIITAGSALGGSGSASGSSTQIQYNTGGSFDASSNFTFDDSTNTFTISGTSNQLGGVNIDNKWRYINTASDLPAPSAGVITLVNEVTYVFTTTVDLAGDRIVCGMNTTLLGASSENCRIKSTGLSGTALITSSSTSLTIRNLTIEADVALLLTGNPATSALDWFGVNFTNCTSVGTIQDYANFTMLSCAFLESSGLVFNGTIGTIAFSQCLFNGTASSTILTLPSTLTITRRFRIIYSSFVVLSGETGIDVSASATIPADAYILTYCNFSGGGTYLAGVDATSNKALFINNVGITNTSNVGHYYMQNNATATTIATQNTFVKAAGTTIQGAGNSPKWTTATTNRLTYAGTISTEFVITVVGAIQSTSGTATLGVAIAKNGTVITESRISVRMIAANVPNGFSCQEVIESVTGDFFEVFVTNETGTQNVTLSDLNVIITKITG